MKKLCAALFALLLAAVVLMAVPAMAAETYVENGGQIPDLNSYSGTWEQAYGQILNNHVNGIVQYEARDITYWSEYGQQTWHCLPIGLEDLNADGIPDLFFIEVASDGNRGDLFIYSWSNNAASCKLYVPGITRLDYDDMLGFYMYRSAYGGDTLVIEHYEYEWPWVLQFSRNAFGQYTLMNYLHMEYDNSGEADDRCFVNGALVSADQYGNLITSIQGAKTWNLSSYMADGQTGYGFTYTWSDAMAMLGYATTGNSGNNGGNNGGNNDGNNGGYVDPYNFTGVYGYTIDKLATRKGPGTQYEGGGTYSVKNQWINVLAKAWDKRNSIWWVKCEIPYHGEIRVLWTGWKRFDHNTISLDQLPEEVW